MSVKIEIGNFDFCEIDAAYCDVSVMGVYKDVHDRSINKQTQGRCPLKSKFGSGGGI
jgi:hypothetical protein